MKVLFVDDEVRVLQGIERILSDVTDFEIEATFVTSAADALDRLARNPPDVVITDMRMPGTNGEELLQLVKRDHPSVLRIMLTGHAENDVLLRMTKEAHQLLIKPCTPTLLTATLRRAASMRRLLQNESFLAAIGSISNLPAAPSTWVELNRILTGSDVDIDQAVALVKRDPALCAKVLQLANSAIFGARGVMTDPKAAALRLGLRTLKAIVLAVGAISKETVVRTDVDLDALQKKALIRATIAENLCEVEGQQETAFTAALLADIGMLVSRSHPDGYTYAELGAYLLGIWGLPDGVIDAVSLQYGNHPDMPKLDAAASVFAAGALLDHPEALLERFDWFIARRPRISKLMGSMQGESR